MPAKQNADSAKHMSKSKEELHDTLIAISVVAKQIAKRMNESQEREKEEDTDGTNEGTQTDS